MIRAHVVSRKVVTSSDALSVKERSIERIEISGHAESGEYGKDLVCAAVSALVITFVNSVEILCGFDLAPEIRSGYVCAMVPADPGIQLLAESLVVGLEGMMHDHAKYIVVKHTLLEDL